MTVCRACRNRQDAETDESTARSGALLLRVWREDDELRCRLLRVTDPSSPARAVGIVQGVDAICDAVRRWLLEL
jgi:hypothetical protein